MTHHQFKLRAASMGFALSKSDCHNILHRAIGRVASYNDNWVLTARGMAYRQEVIRAIQRVLMINPVTRYWMNECYTVENGGETMK